MLSILGAILAIIGISILVFILLVVLSLVIGAGSILIDVLGVVFSSGAAIFGIAFLVWFLCKVWGPDKKDKKKQ